MNTIALDNKTYSNVEWYARQNNISVTEAVISVLNSFLDKIKTKEHPKNKFYISPEVKALLQIKVNFKMGKTEFL